MDRAEILERVRDVVSDVLGTAVSGIEPDDRLLEDLEAEPVQLLELADALGEEFGTEIDEDEMAELSTVSDVVEMIVEILGEDVEEEEEEDEDY